MLFAGGVPPVPNPIGGSPGNRAIGPIAALEQHAANLLQHAIQAAAVARDAAADAADINKAHATIPATVTSSLRAPRELPDSITRASRRC
jgi:hypothetical protein